MRRPRLRLLTLWTGTTVSLLIVAAFAVSAGWFMNVQARTPYGPCVFLTTGSITVVLDDPLVDWAHMEPHSAWDVSQWNAWKRGARHVEVPLYAVLLAVAIPTLFVWRFGRKPVEPGHCQRCGYNLKGLTEARCPECGTPSGDAE